LTLRDAKLSSTKCHISISLMLMSYIALVESKKDYSEPHLFSVAPALAPTLLQSKLKCVKRTKVNTRWAQFLLQVLQYQI
jgi:hypothetical protein